jgi:hypothetical protein
VFGVGCVGYAGCLFCRRLYWSNLVELVVGCNWFAPKSPCKVLNKHPTKQANKQTSKSDSWDLPPLGLGVLILGMQWKPLGKAVCLALSPFAGCHQTSSNVIKRNQTDAKSQPPDYKSLLATKLIKTSSILDLLRTIARRSRRFQHQEPSRPLPEPLVIHAISA